MGAGASGFMSEQEALKAGKSQDEIDAWKKANPKPKFYYFGIPGRGEVIRILLYKVYGKEGWEDVHVKDFGEQKKAFLSDAESTYLATPYLPNLTTPSGLTVGEALAISKWVISQGNAEVKAMYPAGDAGLVVDETLEIMYGINWPQGDTTEEKKAAREKFAAGPLLTILGMYEERLKRTSGPFLLGGQISLADLWSYYAVSNILKGWVDFVDTEIPKKFPTVMANMKAIYLSPLVRNYQEAYKDTYKFFQLLDLSTLTPPKPKLVYFGIPGRAFVIRMLMFKVFGKEGWEDAHSTDFMEQKKALVSGGDSTLATPYLPNLITPSGLKVGEALSISKWVISQGNADVKAMYPEGDAGLVVEEALRIVYGAAGFPGGETPEAKKAAREKYAAGTLLNSLKLFELRLKKTPGPFLLDKQISLADLWAFFVYGGVVNGGFDYVDKTIPTKFPCVMANLKATFASPISQKYQEAYKDNYKFSEYPDLK